MSWLSDLFHGGKNPAPEANKYLQQIPGAVSPYYQPYIDTGLRSLGTLEQQYSQLINNPQATYNQLAGGFEQSPGYQWQYDQATNAANSAAAAGGYSGTQLDQEERGRLAQRLSDEDMQQYLNNILGIQGTGLEGLQHQGDYGYQASQGAADYLGNAYGNQAENAYAGKAQQLKNQSNTFSDLLKGGAQAAGAYFTGGKSLLPNAVEGLQSSFGQQGLNNAGDLQQAYSNYGNNRYGRR